MNTVSDVHTLSQRFVECVVDDKGIIPDDPKMFEALAGALVCDLKVRNAIELDGQVIQARDMVGNTDMPIAFVYDLIKVQPMAFGELAEAISPAHPERYNAVIDELCAPLVGPEGFTQAPDVDGLKAYVAKPEDVDERIQHMMEVVMRTRPNDPYDQGLAILLDYVGMLDELTDGKDLAREFQHRLHKEEGIDAAEGRATKGSDITSDLLAQMIGVAGESKSIL